MSDYKYLAYDFDNDGQQIDDDREIHLGSLQSDSHAIDKAQEDDMAVRDETGSPFVYRQNPNPSTYGCGGDCCSGWILVSPVEATA